MATLRSLPMLLLTLVLCFSPQPISGKIFFSSQGQQCMDDCVLQGFPQHYRCTVNTAYGTTEHQYCSPIRDVDYSGHACTDCCEKHGLSYYWCNTASSWGYCGEVLEDPRHYTSSYEVPCTNGCELHGEDYYWCKSPSGWDYCSPTFNVDFKGRACSQNSPCAKGGEVYSWCNLEAGSWGKCGQVEAKALIYHTKTLKDCIDECQYHESSDYFWCHTRDDWDYCSPLRDVTYKNVPCRSNHKCGPYGKAYSWCYITDQDHWDYCGIISPGECTYSQTHRSKRQPNNPNLICTKEDNNNKRTTKFIEEGNPGNIRKPKKKIYNEALGLINRWQNQGLVDRARSNLIRSDNLRIDLQTPFNRDNRRYYNLQIQLNEPRSSGQSTTIALILVPDDTSAEYMREAFRFSLERGNGVALEVQDQPSTSSGNNNNNQKCRRRPK